MPVFPLCPDAHSPPTPLPQRCADWGLRWTLRTTVPAERYMRRSIRDASGDGGAGNADRGLFLRLRDQFRRSACRAAGVGRRYSCGRWTDPRCAGEDAAGRRVGAANRLRGCWWSMRFWCQTALRHCRWMRWFGPGCRRHSVISRRARIHPATRQPRWLRRLSRCCAIRRCRAAPCCPVFASNSRR